MARSGGGKYDHVSRNGLTAFLCYGSLVQMMSFVLSVLVGLLLMDLGLQHS